ncbi:uncharacterized protein T551_03102 [Pneumocystis jirovecii RU7]|uniref:Uncharacterized protein n=1 Tax=Pneumocystis jirovecii (strain RU7) TaxID=1408657 RepID=A0A0W4ZGU8_PNEJ7|nr:uncharacterized protein T551_03102 [Pneumocystis jirovecii RU7]KTW27603.1 hypothetical protein T551_03102 [Pneumocystis jirovecii RU7]
MSFQALDEEFTAVNSIYPSCFVLLDNNAKIYVLRTHQKPYTIVLKFSEAYPLEKPYIMRSKNIEKSIIEKILAEIPSGNTCIFELISFLEDLELTQKNFNNIKEYKISVNTSSTLGTSFKENEKKTIFQDNIPWVISEILTLKKSKFIGRMLKIKSLDMVHRALESLQHEKSLANATHNIWAYRLIKENGEIICDNDDNGEKGAGSNLSYLLSSMDVKNVLLVVSRWYGGINLGPDRFKLINSCAKAALFLGNAIEDFKIKKNKKKV